MKEARCEQCLGQISESGEYSLKSQTNWPMDEVEQKLQMTSPSSDITSEDRTSNFSESSGKLLENKGTGQERLIRTRLIRSST